MTKYRRIGVWPRAGDKTQVFILVKIVKLQFTNTDILITGVCVCHVLNEKTISLVLLYEILKKLVT